MQFKKFADSGVDIFGFRKEPHEPLYEEDPEARPLKGFDTELMMRYLSRHKIGVNEADSPFMNEIRWGDGWGSVRLEVNPRMLFLIQRLGKDGEGHSRWISKKVFQLNRRGYGGYEEAVAAEVYEHVKQVSESGLEGPSHDFDRLAELTDYVATRLRRGAQSKFLYRGIKKVSDDNFQIVFEVGGQGVEAPNHRKVLQNCTDISYDKHCGTLRVRNFNVEHQAGRKATWQVMPCYLDTWFFPSQDRAEIAEGTTILLKYY